MRADRPVAQQRRHTTQLFYGAIRAIPDGQWQSCSALGMSKKDTLAILLPYAFKRALSSYSNEVVLVFKSTSLAYTITLMEVMGHGQLLYGRTYDVMVFGAAGIIYLIVNGLLTLLMRLVERKALAFERRNSAPEPYCIKADNKTDKSNTCPSFFMLLKIFNHIYCI